MATPLFLTDNNILIGHKTKVIGKARGIFTELREVNHFVQEDRCRLLVVPPTKLLAQCQTFVDKQE